MNIELDEHTPLDLQNLPTGLSAQDAQDLKALAIRLRSQGLNVMLGVSGGDVAFHLAAGDAQTVHGLAGVVVRQAGQLFCPCPDCVKRRGGDRKVRA